MSLLHGTAAQRLGIDSSNEGFSGARFPLAEDPVVLFPLGLRSYRGNRVRYPANGVRQWIRAGIGSGARATIKLVSSLEPSLGTMLLRYCS